MGATWTVPAFGSLERVERPEEPVPAGAVRLALSGWSLNYRDLLMFRGRYDPRVPRPYVPLSDAVGRVVEVGPEAVLAIGDRVCPTFSPTWRSGPPDADAVRKTRGGPLPGVAATTLVLPAAELVRVPEALTDAEAATLPCAGVTAWAALFRHGAVRPGSTVLVQGTGGVSLFALQLAKAAGAHVVALTSSEAKAERLVALGADVVLDYVATPRWGALARKHGVDLVVDVGGAATVRESVDAVKVGGTVALVGNLGAGPGLDPVPALMKGVRLQGVFVGSRQDFVDLVAGLGALRPVVDRELPFEALPEALDALEARAHVGKVALVARGPGRPGYGSGSSSTISASATRYGTYR